MKLKDMVVLIQNAAAEGSAKALANNAAMTSLICKAEAYRHYGRTLVDRWINEGLLEVAPSAKSSKMMIDRVKLEAVAASSNRVTYLPVAER